MASTLRRQSARTLRVEGKVVCSCGCGQHPKPPRRTWFSDACVESWKIKNDPSHIRFLVFKRDKGICALCGCDSVAEYGKWMDSAREAHRLVERLFWMRCNDAVWDDARRRWIFARDGEPDYAEEKRRRNELLTKWMPPGNWTRGRSTGWDADHIVPVVEGGGQCDLSNYRTLCHPCHKGVTAELAKRRAKQRKAPQPELFAT